MSDKTKSLSLSIRDREGLIVLMRWHLARLRQITPWPLDLNTTHLLWWTEEAWSTLNQLRSSGQMPGNGKHNVLLQVFPDKKAARLNHSGGVLFGGGSNLDRVPVLRDSVGYPEFIEWHQEVYERNTEMRQVMEAWAVLLNEATSWRQLYKAFPESFEIIVGATSGYVATVSETWGTRSIRSFVIPKMREAWSQVRGTNYQSSRAYPMPAKVQELLTLARPVAGRLCSQAVLLPPENSGKLDDSLFGQTWV